MQKSCTPCTRTGWGAGKQLGIKGHRDPSGQAECEPGTRPCQEGQPRVGVRATAASRPGETAIPF